MKKRSVATKKALALLMFMTIAAGLTGCAPKNADVPLSGADEAVINDIVKLNNDGYAVEKKGKSEKTSEASNEIYVETAAKEAFPDQSNVSESSASYITRENDKWKFFKFDGDHSKKIGIRNADYLEVKSNELCLSDFEYSPNVEVLVIGELSSNDLSGIENFPNIKRLKIDQGTHISDISDIVKCQNIEILTFHLTDPANDYSYLGELVNLKKLRVILTGDDNDKEYKAINIESIGSCQNLEVLALQHFYMDNMDFLKPLKNLKTLNYMTTCQESMDISPLLGMEKLEELVITHYNSDDISVFLRLDSLKILEIYGNEYSQESIDKLTEAFSGRDIVI